MSSHRDRPKLYGELAPWFHTLTSPEEYAEEAEFYRQVMTEAAEIPVKTVLELGSGGGNNASHLKAHFDMTLVDLSDEMLEVSWQLNPESEHVQGDMRTLRLGRQFDAVFVHDAVSYITTANDLRATIATAYEHCKKGGVALFVPDEIQESFLPTTRHGGNDGPERSLRYLEWAWDPDPSDETYVVDYAYLLKDENGEVRVEHDRHICGVFPGATWLRLLEEIGFRSERIQNIDEEVGRDNFVGLKPL